MKKILFIVLLGFLCLTSFGQYITQKPNVSHAIGILPIVNGGTNASTANAGLNNLLPSQTSNSGKYLTTDGSNSSWATVSGGGTASVTITNTTTNATFYPTLVSSTSGNLPLYTSSGLFGNPSTNQYTISSTFNGSNLSIQSNQNNAGLVLKNTGTGGVTYEFDVTKNSSGFPNCLTLSSPTHVMMVANSSDDVGLGGNITTNTLTGAALKIINTGVVTAASDFHTLGKIYSDQPNSGGATDRLYSIGSRYNTTLAFPVVAIRPQTANQRIGFDVMPNGTPGASAFPEAWIDVEDADNENGEAASVEWLRLGMKAGYGATVGTMQYTGTVLPLYFVINGVASWKINTSKHLIPIGNNTLDIGKSDSTIRTGYFGTSIVTPICNISGTQTSVNASTSGTVKFSQPQQGTTYKVVMITGAAAVGTASYTFPTAFTVTPSVVASNDIAAGFVTSLSTTAVTVTGATSTGSIMLIGY